MPSRLLDLSGGTIAKPIGITWQVTKEYAESKYRASNSTHPLVQKILEHNISAFDYSGRGLQLGLIYPAQTIKKMVMGRSESTIALECQACNWRISGLCKSGIALITSNNCRKDLINRSYVTSIEVKWPSMIMSVSPFDLPEDYYEEWDSDYEDDPNQELPSIYLHRFTGVVDDNNWHVLMSFPTGNTNPSGSICLGESVYPEHDCFDALYNYSNTPLTKLFERILMQTSNNDLGTPINLVDWLRDLDDASSLETLLTSVKAKSPPRPYMPSGAFFAYSLNDDNTVALGPGEEFLTVALNSRDKSIVVSTTKDSYVKSYDM